MRGYFYQARGRPVHERLKGWGRGGPGRAPSGLSEWFNINIGIASSPFRPGVFRQAGGRKPKQKRKAELWAVGCVRSLRRRAEEARAGSPNQPPPARLFISTHRSALTICLLSFFPFLFLSLTFLVPLNKRESEINAERRHNITH